MVDMYRARSPSSGRTCSKSSGLSVRHTWFRMLSKTAPWSLSAWYKTSGESTHRRALVRVVRTSGALSEMADSVLIKKLTKSARLAMSFKPSTVLQAKQPTRR
jgi:hypothetical protein